jgi:hypothetical protein
VGNSFRVIASLFELVVAWRILAVADNAFEKSVLSVLILIYTRAAETRLELSYRFAYLFAEIGKRFVGAYRLMSERPSKLWAADQRASEVRKRVG